MILVTVSPILKPFRGKKNPNRKEFNHEIRHCQFSLEKSRDQTSVSFFPDFIVADRFPASTLTIYGRKKEQNLNNGRP